MAEIHGKNIVRDGLVLHLDAANPQSYDGNSNKWRDLSGNGNHGTLVNGPTYSSSNKGSIVFDGVNDYGNIGNITYNRNTFSVCEWINFPSYHTNWRSCPGLSKWYTGGGRSNNEWYLGINNISGPAPFAASVQYDASNIVSIVDTVNYTINTWYYICMTWNNGVFNLYVNSNLKASTTVMGATSVVTTSQPVYIAAFLYPNYQANSKVGICSLYNKDLSQQEITQNYNATKSRYGL